MKLCDNIMICDLFSSLLLLLHVPRLDAPLSVGEAGGPLPPGRAAPPGGDGVFVLAPPADPHLRGQQRAEGAPPVVRHTGVEVAGSPKSTSMTCFRITSCQKHYVILQGDTSAW